MTATAGDNTGFDISALWKSVFKTPPEARTGLSLSEAQALAVVLGSKLAAAFGVEFVVDVDAVSVEGGDMSASARTRRPLGGLLSLDLLAHMFVSRIEGGKFTVSAVIFAFSHSRRLVVPGDGDFLSLELDPDEGIDASWRSLGWCSDEYGEWSGLTTLDASA